MSTWNLAKKLKETHLSSGFGRTSSSTSAIKERNQLSLLNTQPNLNSKNSTINTKQEGISQESFPDPIDKSTHNVPFRPGLLTVHIHETKDLSFPQSHAKYASYLTSNHNIRDGTSTLSKSNGTSPPPVYLVLEFDKTQLVFDSTAGIFECPIWEAHSSFDVSRPETLTINIYAKLTASSIRSIPGSNEIEGLSRSTGSSFFSNSKRKNSLTFFDVFLGSLKLTPKFQPGVVFDGWKPFSSGIGYLRLSLEYKVTKNEPLSIKDFELLAVIGKGSFGKVMQVRKKDTKQIYAIKTIRKARIVSRSEVTHTLAERTVLAQIDNPFIVPLKFSFQTPEKLYLVLAFVNGGELFHHLQKAKVFDLNRARFYTAELLCALECLHEFNVIYRDLKPENILLDNLGHIALCDFGLCKLNMDNQERTNTFCGTPEYLSPEILLGHGYTKTVDWWTLGVLLYEMLTGLPPFYSQNINEMYQHILNDPLQFPENMDRQARLILIGLLNRNPDKRLGVNGASEIKSHPFFNDIDWKRLMAKKYAAPFIPSVGDENDTSNFDHEFTSEFPTDSVANDYLSDSVQRQFGGWTYVEKSELR